MADKPRVFTAGPEGTAPPGGPHVASATAPADELKARTISEMTFSTHVLSLNDAALAYLGALPDVTDQPVDLDVAGHLIDTLAMLREKSRGNLTPAEVKLLDTVLYELRLKHVAARR